MAVAELLFDETSTTTSLEFLETSLPIVIDDPAVARNATSVAGVTTSTAAGRVVLVVAYDPTAYFGGNALDASLIVPAFANMTFYTLDTTNALYDRLWRDLNATGGLEHDDGHLYKLKKMARAPASDEGLRGRRRGSDAHRPRRSSVARPRADGRSPPRLPNDAARPRTDGLHTQANDDGLDYVEARLDEYLAFQNASLASAAFPGSVWRNDTHARLSWEMAVPSVSAFVLW